MSQVYDHIIVGSGAAGCVLANRLSADPKCRVLLIEAGPKDSSPFVRIPNGMIPIMQRGLYIHSQESEPQSNLNGRKIFDTRGKVLGGGTSINNIQVSRGTRQDYDNWAQLGNEGWSYDDVLPYFKKMETFSRGANLYRGGDGPVYVSQAPVERTIAQDWINAGGEAGFKISSDLNGEQMEGFGPPDEAIYKGRRVSAVSAYLKPVKSRKNLTILTDATVLKLIIVDKKCKGVEYKRNDQSTIVEGENVILSAGVHGSPQLLMLSGVGDKNVLKKHGIETALHLPGVGQNLQDHLGFMIRISSKASVSDLRHMGIMAKVRAVLEYLFLRRGFLARSSVRAIAVLNAAGSRSKWPDFKVQFFNMLVEDNPSMSITRHGFLVRISMRPKSRGEVTLRSANPTDTPRIDANYLSHPDDIERARSGVRMLRKVFQQPAMAKYGGEEVSPGVIIESDTDIDNWLRANATGDAHGAGTCKMGNDIDCVVDNKLKVRGIENLMVVDTSIMPTLVCGNTMAPAMMIAEKAAAIILDNDA